MKTLNYLLAVVLIALFSCTSTTKTTGQKVTFGIYEIVNSAEIPQSVINTLKSRGVTIENNRQPMMGYVKKSDSTALRVNLSGQNFRLFRTINPVDKNQQHYAVVAVRLTPFMDNADIKKSRTNGKNVEIDFTYNGAKKWAGFTKKNVGHWAAFVINDRIYSTPMIVGEIKSGIALIQGFKNEKSAQSISESLNLSRLK